MAAKTVCINLIYRFCENTIILSYADRRQATSSHLAACGVLKGNGRFEIKGMAQQMGRVVPKM
jgi:hypothetical protein